MSAQPQTFVVVGARLTGAKAAEALREESFDGSVATRQMASSSRSGCGNKGVVAGTHPNTPLDALVAEEEPNNAS